MMLNKIQTQKKYVFFQMQNTHMRVCMEVCVCASWKEEEECMERGRGLKGRERWGGNNRAMVGRKAKVMSSLTCGVYFPLCVCWDGQKRLFGRGEGYWKEGMEKGKPWWGNVLCVPMEMPQWGAGDMAQQLTALTVLAERVGWGPSIHAVPHNLLQPQCQETWGTLLASVGSCTHLLHINTCRVPNIYIHSLKKKNIKSVIMKSIILSLTL